MEEILIITVFGVLIVPALLISQFRLLRKRNPNMELLIALWKQVNTVNTKKSD